MKTLTLDDVRNELFAMLKSSAQYLSDNELLEADFWHDLHMDEQNVLTLAYSLQQSHRIFLPMEVMACLKEDNTVGCFLNAANRLLQDLEEN